MRVQVLLRVLGFAAGVLACALVTGLAALLTTLLRLPPTDLAYRQGLFRTLSDPFVLTVWLVLTLGAALVAFPIAMWALWRVRLVKAVPVVVLASVAGAILGASAFPPFSPVLALLAATVAIVQCRRYAPWRTPEPGQPSTHPGTG